MDFHNMPYAFQVKILEKLSFPQLVACLKSGKLLKGLIEGPFMQQLKAQKNEFLQQTIDRLRYEIRAMLDEMREIVVKSINLRARIALRPNNRRELIAEHKELKSQKHRLKSILCSKMQTYDSLIRRQLNE